MCIHFLLAENAYAPLHKVIMEDALMELVEDIGCDAGKDVGEGNLLPKWFVDFAQTFLIKFF